MLDPFFHCCHSHLLFITKQTGRCFDTDVFLIFTCQKPREKNISEYEKYGKYKEGMEWNRKGKMPHEVHVIKKSAKRTYLNLGITIRIKQNKVASENGIP